MPKQATEHPMTPFLAWVVGSGVNVGLLERQRVAQLLSLAGPWTLTQLGQALATLLTHDPVTHQAFIDAFRARFKDLDADMIGGPGLLRRLDSFWMKPPHVSSLMNSTYCRVSRMGISLSANVI